MREIRVKNLSAQDLVLIVTSLKKEYTFLIDKNLYTLLKSKAEVISCEESMMSFITWYGEHPKYPIKTWIKFKVFCEEFYSIESITVDRNLIYGHSGWKDSATEQFVIRRKV